jgi:phosphoribosylformimino-5-aminoimidazole carboxamide ribotide isomerase
MKEFHILPAIDLRQGQVVRLRQGDPHLQTVYDTDPTSVAERWLSSGAHWLHVVNLDGAFGEGDHVNLAALKQILTMAKNFGASVQFGGGLRSMDMISTILSLGVQRAVLGTILIEQPNILKQTLGRFGPERIAAGVDAKNGVVQVRGWQKGTSVTALELTRQMMQEGLRWLIFTDIARDGVGNGLNLTATREIIAEGKNQVIASGGVNSTEDVRMARASGCAGVIIGKAIYEGKIQLNEVIDLEISQSM